MDGHQRQREQSGRMIEESLFALMEEKKLEEITVSEIVKRADVARRTFYRLYNRKEDVLCDYVHRLSEEYKRTFPALKNYDLERIAEDFFCFWYLHRDFLLLLYRCGLEEMLYHELSQISADLIRNRIESSQEREKTDVVYFAHYSAGGFLMLLHHWILDGMTESPKEYARKVSKILVEFIRPGGNPV